jgi:hypothetical protein
MQFDSQKATKKARLKLFTFCNAHAAEIEKEDNFPMIRNHTSLDLSEFHHQ